MFCNVNDFSRYGQTKILLLGETEKVSIIYGTYSGDIRLSFLADKCTVYQQCYECDLEGALFLIRKIAQSENFDNRIERVAYLSKLIQETFENKTPMFYIDGKIEDTTEFCAKYNIPLSENVV